MSRLTLTSDAFESGQPIPDKYTCEGEDISPPLAWRPIPDGTKSLVLICDDPDAPRGVWSHWVLYNIPANIDRLAEHMPAEAQLNGGGTQGRNDFGNLGYGGPCPPLDSTHTYYFRLYALDRDLNLPPGATRQQVYDQMQDHILATAELLGRYGRS